MVTQLNSDLIVMCLVQQLRKLVKLLSKFGTIPKINARVQVGRLTDIVVAESSI